jgi:transcription termination factor NusB
VAHSFDKAQLEGYEHRPDMGENVVVKDEATAAALEEALEAEASLEAYVLTAPPPLVYNSFAIKLARSLVNYTAERWLQHEAILMEIIPAKWKAQPKGALLQICILQMALAEMETTDVPPSVLVIETVELSKRFCDLAAPRIINGCLGSYIRRTKIYAKAPAVSASEKLERELVSEPLQPEDLGFAEDYAD